MEVKFNNYFKKISWLVYFGVVIIHHAKFAGLKYLIQAFHSNMNHENNVIGLIFNTKVCWDIIYYMEINNLPYYFKLFLSLTSMKRIIFDLLSA